MKQTGNLNHVGMIDAPILVITDAPGKHAYDTGTVMSGPQMKLLQRLANEHGIAGSNFRMLTPCPSIPDEIATSERKVGDFLLTHRAEFLERALAHEPKLIVTLGKTALRQLAGKSVKITEARGSMTTYAATGDVPVLPLLSPAHVLRRPELAPIFAGDFRQIATLIESGWDASVFENATDQATYEWCLDLSELLANRPRVLSLDTETRGLEWRGGRQAILCVQLTVREGHALVVPLDLDYFNDDSLRGKSSRHLPKLTETLRGRLLDQLAELLGDPSVKVAGHNLTFDIHHLRNYGIDVANWAIDTIQLAFACDDNMQTKSLDECVRRWVPEMAAYADAFNAETDKGNMQTVPHDKMLRYAGGDTDAVYRLATRLVKECRKDQRQWDCFQHVQMPGLRAFLDVEEAGIGIDRQALRELGTTYDQKEKEQYDALMVQAAKKAPKVLRDHQDKGLRFSRDSFVADLLFGEDGFKLKPKVWTPSTRKLPMEERIPSVSTKEHLPFFDHIPFVRDLMTYQKLTKMRTTYIGSEGGVEHRRIDRLKNGKLPAAAAKAFLDAGIDFIEKKTPSQPVRRRSIVTATKPLTSAHQPAQPVQQTGPLILDANGVAWRAKETEPSGFWQYLLTEDRIHPRFRLDNTVTGRTSSQNPNAQNFPKRGPAAKDFRRIFVPRHGCVFIEADLSQAELRIAAWMANEQNMLRIYREGGDIHAATAAGVLGLRLEDVTKDDRQKAKAVNFGFLYGMWWTKFMSYAKTDYGVTFTPKQAEAIRSRFFDMYPGLARWHKDMANFVKEHGYVRALHGALRRLPSIYSDDEVVRKDTERQAINSPVQRFASDLGVMALGRFNQCCPRELMRPVAFIHDAVIVEAREEVAEEAAAALKYCMQSIPLEDLFGIKPPLPIVSDVSIGTNLANLIERPDIAAAAPVWLTL